MQHATNLRIEFSPLFDKKLRILPKEIIIAFKSALEVLRETPSNSSLRRHFLKEKYAGYQSIDVTQDYRAIFREENSGNIITIKFHLIGTHKELYRKKK